MRGPGRIAISHEHAPLTQVPLLELTWGFMNFKTFAAALELGLFTMLADGEQVTADEFADRIGLQARPARVLLAACASLGLLTKRGDKYLNSELAEKYLVAGQPEYFGGFVTFYDRLLYPAWHRLPEALRTGSPVAWDPDNQDFAYSPADEALTEVFWEAMFALARSTANALAGVYDFTAHRRLLDVGGGSGGFPIALCERHPELTATVFELPHVCPLAAAKIEAAGLTARIGTVPGDFLKDDELPGGHDIALLSQILHNHDEPANRALLAKVYAALPAGGAVLICELLLNDERTGPPAAAVMGVNMVVGMTGGENYAEGQYGRWLTDTGFTDVRVVRFSAAGANGAVVARKP